MTCEFEKDFWSLIDQIVRLVLTLSDDQPINLINNCKPYTYPSLFSSLHRYPKWPHQLIALHNNDQFSLGGTLRGNVPQNAQLYNNTALKSRPSCHSSSGCGSTIIFDVTTCINSDHSSTKDLLTTIVSPTMVAPNDSMMHWGAPTRSCWTRLMLLVNMIYWKLASIGPRMSSLDCGILCWRVRSAETSLSGSVHWNTPSILLRNQDDFSDLWWLSGTAFRR